MSKRKTTRNQPLTGEAFDALPAAEKERIYQELDAMTPEQIKAASRPIGAREWARMHQPRKAGRPRRGAGVKVIAVSLEQGVLKRADSYAKKNKLKRSELITQGILSVIGAV
jgi:hypothetical protein